MHSSTIEVAVDPSEYMLRLAASPTGHAYKSGGTPEERVAMFAVVCEWQVAGGRE